MTKEANGASAKPPRDGGSAAKQLRHPARVTGALASSRMHFPRGEKAMKTKNLGAYSIGFAMALLVLIGLALWLGPARLLAGTPDNLDWRHYGNDLANTRFQNVDQINRSNVGNLTVAWVFHTGVLDELAELQASPIVINGRMFVTDGHDNLFDRQANLGLQASRAGRDAAA